MLRNEAIELVRQLEMAVNTHDTARILKFYSDDAVTVSPMLPGTAGLAAIAKGWDTIFSLFPDWTVHLADVLVDDDRIAFLGTAAATDRNGWFGQPATGERIEYRVIVVLTIADGKIVRDERIYDLTGVLQRLEKARLDKELSLAAEVQRVLLSRTRHSTEFCEAVGDSVPCRTIGGDFFELLHLPSGDFGIALGDVAGKGPAAAILAAMIQGMLAVEAQTAGSPSDILTRLNRSLFHRGLQPQFATMAYGVLSPNGRFVCSNAGHNPPIVLMRDGLRRLTVGGPILGVFSDAAFAEETVQLGKGDTVIMFSDGVTEASNSQEQEFGEERLISCVTAAAMKSGSDILREVLSTVQQFCQDTAQTDDITVALTRYSNRSI